MSATETSRLQDNRQKDTRPKAVWNKTWAQLEIGDHATIERVCLAQDLFLFAHVSGNTNPLMLPPLEDAPRVGAPDEPVAPSMWVGSLISAVLGNLLPGPGTLYRSQTLEFQRRVHVGDRLTVTVTCREKRQEPVAVFETTVIDAEGLSVCHGTAVVEAPLSQRRDALARIAGADRRPERSFRPSGLARRAIAPAKNRGGLPRGS